MPETTDNARSVKQMFQAVEERDLPKLLAVYAPDIEIHEAPSLPYGGVYKGHDGAQAHATGFVTTWGPFQRPEQRRLDVQIFGSGGQFAGVWRLRASSGGRDIDRPAITMCELEAGLIRRLQMFHYDTAALVHWLERAAAEASPGPQ